MVSPSSVLEPTRPWPSCQSHITVTTAFFALMGTSLVRNLRKIFVSTKSSCFTGDPASKHFFNTLADALEILRMFGRLHTALQIENIPAHHPEDDLSPRMTNATFSPSL